MDAHPPDKVEEPSPTLPGTRLTLLPLGLDEPQPAKHQVAAGEAEAGRDEEEQHEDGEPEDKDVAEEVADDQSIPELAESDDGDAKMEPVDRNFVEESDDDEVTATRRPEDGPTLELPDAKRSRLSRITAMQGLCKLEQVKERKDVKEIMRQL